MAARLNIVLVEDHADFRLMLTRVLESIGHRVQAYASAEEMLDHAAAMQAELFIIDLNLPGEDGLSLSQRLRALSPQVYIVLVTARVAKHDRVQGYESGADLYLAKPVDVAELQAVLRRFAQRKGGGVPVALQGGFSLKRRLLTSEQNEVLLTQDESLLLTAMAHAPAGQLETWQFAELLDSDLSERFQSNLAVRMARLRKKLIQVGATGMPIQSLPNVGYQLLVKVRFLA